MRFQRGALVRALALPLLLLAPLAPPFPAPAQEPLVQRLGESNANRRREAIVAHGINLNGPALRAFLGEGFSQDAVARGLPSEPPVKTELVNLVIEEIGMSQDTASRGVLEQLARGEFTPGVSSILARDTEQMPVDASDQVRAFYASFVRVNALIALGYLGDPAAAPAIAEVVAREQAPSYKVEGAIALGLLGDPSGLGALMLEVRDPAREDLDQFFLAVYLLTGRNYNVTDNTSVANRRKVASEFRAWYQREGAGFVPSRTDILRRRAEGLPEFQLPLDTLRGALRGTRNVGNFDVRYAARERLRSIGPSAVPELKAIATDPLEDLDIRRAALEYYAAADPRGARKVIRTISREDENPVIREAAANLLPEIDRLLKS